MNWLLFWLIAAVFFAVIELITLQLVSIWLAAGSVGAMIALSFNASVPLQFLVFVIISGVLLIFTRPIVKRLTVKKVEATNADRLIGQVATVTEEISNHDAKGAVLISGVTWTARSVDNTVIPKGDKVKIERIEGVKLIVSKIYITEES